MIELLEGLEYEYSGIPEQQREEYDSLSDKPTTLVRQHRGMTEVLITVLRELDRRLPVLRLGIDISKLLDKLNSLEVV